MKISRRKLKQLVLSALILLSCGALSQEKGAYGPKELTARTGSAVKTVQGESAVTIDKPSAYDFTHAIFSLKNVAPEDTLELNVRASLAEGCRTGKIGAILFIRKDKKWVRLSTMFWNKTLTEKYTDIKIRKKFSQLGAEAKAGRYMLLIYKMRNTEGAAVSKVEWLVEKSSEQK